MLILKKGLDIHRDKVPEALQPFHAHMESRYHEMKIVLEREYGIKVSWFVRECLFFYEKKCLKRHSWQYGCWLFLFSCFDG